MRWRRNSRSRDSAKKHWLPRPIWSASGRHDSRTRCDEPRAGHAGATPPRTHPGSCPRCLLHALRRSHPARRRHPPALPHRHPPPSGRLPPRRAPLRPLG
ncbi:MAG: hypothetical protein F4Y73_00130, partial [Gemmatimonadetes bacterium]|nr:hypothetical protein [Gemmatimonadota bacterium]